MPKKSKPFNKATPFKNGGGKIHIQFNEADNEPAEIRIYQDIGEDPWSGKGFTAQDFADALEEIPRSKPLDIRINSAGGSVWDGMAIKTLLDEWPARKTASIDGMAASTASWLPMSCDEIRAPKHAQMFIHDAWGVSVGNAADMRETADQLEKSSKQIADIYASKTGMSSADCRKLMVDHDGTLMTAEQAHDLGFIDRITDDNPIANFSDAQVAKMRDHLALFRNSLSASTKGGAKPSNQTTEDQMKRDKMIALLNKWGVKFEDSATDDQLWALVEAGKPENAKTQPKSKKSKKNEDSDEDGDGKPGPCKDEDSDDDTDDGEGDGGMNKILAQALNAAAEAKKHAEQMAKEVANQLRASVTERVKNLISSDKIGATQLETIVNLALENAGKDGGVDKVLGVFDALPERPPGFAPLNIQVGETSSVEDLAKAINKLGEPQAYFTRNHATPSLGEREELGRSSAERNRIVNRLKKYNAKGEMVGPLRDMWDSWAVSPRNANTMDTGLLRQVILSEIMRAFKRQFATLSLFSHTYQNVPLQGNDKVEVPYYPLDTVASTEFKYANGYVIGANAQTLKKEIQVGGIGDGNASAGRGRKYKTLQFTAYEIRRQPWLNIAQLTVMAGEQLAIDVRAEILGANISAANFGNAIWTGAAGGFDHTVVTQYLLNAAIKAFWPIGSRHCVLAPDYYTTLLADPNLSRYLEAGTDSALRDAEVGRLYGFEQITVDPLIPVANFIRGGDGATTTGGDTNSVGFIAYPSSILIATAPIMPPPGVLKKLVSYEQVTDDQTGLAFTYQYFGVETANADSEIIECTYGSVPGELAALKRLTSSGV